jgi:hypothetical protein
MKISTNTRREEEKNESIYAATKRIDLLCSYRISNNDKRSEKTIKVSFRVEKMI